MPIFIKTGYWSNKRKALAGELDLDLWLQKNLPTPPVTTTTTTTQAVSTYKIYSAIITQTGTNNLTATVLEKSNQFDIYFTRISAGNYTIDSPQFVRGKTIINGINPYIESDWELDSTSVSFPIIKVGGGPPTTNREIKIPGYMYKTGTAISILTNQEGIATDSVLSKLKLFVEIRVYN